MTTTTLKQTLRYISHFGPKAGLQAARLHLRPGAIVRVQLPALKYPLWARAGTSDVATFDEVFVAEHYRLPLPDFEPRSILDLGANVGYASIYFAARWPQARILAVEPALPNVELLIKNTATWTGITHLHAAVWPQPTSVCIANPDDDPNAYRMSEVSAPGTETIPAYTIPQLIEQQGCERLDLLKMDIEVAEFEIFQNGTAWLDRVNVLIVELHDRLVPGCAQALYHALHRRRFRQEVVGNNLAIDFR